MFKVIKKNIKVKSLFSLTLLASMVTFGMHSSVKAEQIDMSEIVGSEKFLKMTADMMNSSLPMMLDEDTKWDSSFAGPGKSLTYNYTLVNYSANQIDGSLFANNIRTTLTDGICTTPATQIFPDNGVLLNFNYYDNTRNLIARVKVAPNDCK